MSNKLVQLLQERNISKYKLSKDTGIPPSSITDWTKHGRQPSGEKLAIVADYFNVTVDYLLGKDEKPVIQKDNGQVEAFINLFQQINEEQRLEIIAKMLGYAQGQK